MRNKKFIIFILLVLVLVTISAYITDTSVNKVRIRGQNLVIKQEEANFTNQDVDISLSGSKFENQNLDTSSSNIEFSQNKFNLKNSKTKINSKGEVSNIESRLQGNSFGENHSGHNPYIYKKISWNEWKSNFINKFLDDSVYLACLDEYGLGTWFYYSFEVTKYGGIYNIKVFSFYLKPEDKQAVKNLIQSYANKPITAFPENSKREKAKVEAIVLLGDSETRTKPSDFNDLERIKIKSE